MQTQANCTSRATSARGRRSAAPRVAAIAAVAALTFGLSACGGSDLEIKEASAGAENPVTQRPYGPSENPERGGLFGDALKLGSAGEQQQGGAQLPVNKFIWRATLETLGGLNFLTLASTDPYGGVIISDWGVPPETPDERVKVTAFITSAELKPQSLSVQVNRQRRGDAGAWTPMPVSPDTARSLEDAILTRARQLRIASGEEE